jgi:GTP-binding protein
MTSEAESARLLFAGPCDFIWGTGDLGSLPPQSLPEVAFVGRSNVGKSSLVNALTGRKTLARVSQTPGRTRELNFFNLGGQLMLVDLPGYGYAKASRDLAMEWQNVMLAYLAGRATLRRVVVLIDSRHGLKDTDLAVMELLDKSAVSYVLALTKTDEQSASGLEKVMSEVSVEAKKHTAALAELFATSSLKARGLEALKTHIAALAQY